MICLVSIESYQYFQAGPYRLQYKMQRLEYTFLVSFHHVLSSLMLRDRVIHYIPIIYEIQLRLRSCFNRPLNQSHIYAYEALYFSVYC